LIINKKLNKEEVMAVADSSIDPKLLESAKKEFLQRGFELASLKDICDRAQVTTGALYNRYKGKEELFVKVVEETVLSIEEARSKRSSIDLEAASDEDLKKMWKMNKESLYWWFELFEKHKDGVILLIRCSAGTRYANFKHDFVEVVTETSYEIYEEMKRRKLTSKNISKKIMHTVHSAYFEMVYEPYVHGFSWEEICEIIDAMMNLLDFEKFIGIK
jgi:hypothetical protein